MSPQSIIGKALRDAGVFGKGVRLQGDLLQHFKNAGALKDEATAKSVANDISAKFNAGKTGARHDSPIENNFTYTDANGATQNLYSFNNLGANIYSGTQMVAPAAKKASSTASKAASSGFFTQEGYYKAKKQILEDLKAKNQPTASQPSPQQTTGQSGGAPNAGKQSGGRTLKRFSGKGHRDDSIEAMSRQIEPSGDLNAAQRYMIQNRHSQASDAYAAMREAQKAGKNDVVSSIQKQYGGAKTYRDFQMHALNDMKKNGPGVSDYIWGYKMPQFALGGALAVGTGSVIFNAKDGQKSNAQLYSAP